MSKKGVPYQFPIGVTLVNNTAKTETVTVPLTEMWLVSGLAIYNGDNVARNCKIHIQNSTPVEGFCFHNGSVNANTWAYTPTGTIPYTPFLLDSGYSIVFSWTAGGASAGGTGYYTILCERIGKPI